MKVMRFRRYGNLDIVAEPHFWVPPILPLFPDTLCGKF